MKKLAKKVLIAGAAVGVGAFALHEYLQSSMRSELDKQIRKASPFAHVQYQNFELQLPDRIQISGIRIIPKSPNIGNFALEELGISIRDNDSLYLLKRLLGLGRGNAPDELEVEVDNFSLSLQEFPQYKSMLMQLNQHLNRQMTPFCGDTHFIGPKQFKDLGFDPMVMDLNFSYSFNPWEETLQLSFDAELENSNSTRAQIKLLNIPALNQDLTANMMRPSIERISIHYEDNGYTQKVNEYCAKKSQLSLEEFIARETSRPDKDYALMWGFVPGDNLMQAYTQFLQDPQRVNLRVEPSPNFDWMTLPAYPPEQWPETLNVTLTVNDEPVTTLDFELAELNQLLSAAEPSPPKPSVFDTGVPPKPEPPAAEPELKYVQIDKRRIREYQGMQMRIYSPSGKTREGTFTGMDGNNAKLTQQKFGGTFEMSVSLFGVDKIEVGLPAKK